MGQGEPGGFGFKDDMGVKEDLGGFAAPLEPSPKHPLTPGSPTNLLLSMP